MQKMPSDVLCVVVDGVQAPEAAPREHVGVVLARLHYLKG